MRPVDHMSLPARLKEAGFAGNSTVVLKFAPGEDASKLHWPLWRLKSQRWIQVRIEMPEGERRE